MKQIIIITFASFMLFGCAKKPEPTDSQSTLKVDTRVEKFGETSLMVDNFSSLSRWKEENYEEVLTLFIKSCQKPQVKKLYENTCRDAPNATNAKTFLHQEFLPYKIMSEKSASHGLLTGYYEPYIKASLQKKGKFIYPIYRKPKDLITVELASVYPELKHLRLRGRLVGDKLVPYHTRAMSEKYPLDAEVLCYTDSKIDRFFLEIQGSGKVLLDNKKTMFVGFENQNGHKYRAIGKYLVTIGALRLEEVSLQSIRSWLEKNPSRVDEVLNYNESMVFFQQRTQGATGALGVELTPKRSVAVDRRFIPLGSMLYVDARFREKNLSKVVFAQDTGGAIKGALRADLFLGSGEEALDIAGHLKAPLQVWILLPRERELAKI